MKHAQNNDQSGRPPSQEKKPSTLLCRVLRMLLFALLGIVGLLGLLLVAVQTGPVRNRLRVVLEQTVSSRLGATFRIERIEGNLLSSVALEGVALAGPDNAPFLSIERLSVDFRLSMALLKIIHLDDVTLRGLRLHLAKSETGEWILPSFSGSTPSPSPKTQAPFPFRVHVLRLLISDTRITVREPRTDPAGSPFLDIHNIRAAVDYGNELTVSFLESDFELYDPVKLPVAMSGKLSFQPEASRAEIESLAVTSGATRIVLNGDCRFDDEIPVFSASIDADQIDLREISKTFSLTGLPESTLSGTVKVSGTPGNFLHSISLNMGEGVLTENGSSGFDANRGLWAELSVGIDDLDLSSHGLPYFGVLSGKLSADISFSGNSLTTPRKADAVSAVKLHNLFVAGIPLETVLCDATWSEGTASVPRLEVISGRNRLELQGTLAPYARTSNLDVTADLAEPAPLMKRLSQQYPNLPFAIEGKTLATVSLDGWIDRPTARITIRSDGLGVLAYRADNVSITGIWEGLPGPENRIDDIDITIRGLDGEGLRADTVSLKGNWQGWLDDPMIRFSLSSDKVAAFSQHADRVELAGAFQGLPGPGNRIDDIVLAVKSLGGEFLQADTLSLEGNWHGWLDEPATGFSLTASGLAADRLQVDDVKLSGDLEGLFVGETARSHVTLRADGVRYDQIETKTLALSADCRGPYTGLSGQATIEAGETSAYGQQFKDISLAGRIVPDAADFTVSADHENGSRFEIGGNVASWKTAPRNITLDTVFIATNAPWPVSTLSNATPVRFSLADDRLRVEDCQLRLDEATLYLAGELSADGTQNLKLDIAHLSLESIPGNWNTSARLSGTVSLESTLGGSLSRPVMSSHVNVKDLSGFGISYPTDLSATVDYADASVSFQADLVREESSLVSATGNVPLMLSLRPFSLASVEKNMAASVETNNLKLSEFPIPQLKGIEWDAVVNMALQVSGPPQSPDLAGNITIRDGQITLVKNKLTYESVTADISLSNDRVVIDSIDVKGDREGHLTAGGTIYVQEDMPLIADLSLSGDNFFIPFQKAISARISPDLRLTGAVNHASLSGEVTISESRINLDRLSRSTSSDIQVVENTASDSDSAMLVVSQSQSPDFLSSLTADIQVHVPRNAWLKGQDVYAEIAGDVAIRKSAGGSFTLQGPLKILRGNYYFMGKNFQLTEGDVEFLGLKEINPNLNIETRTRIKSVTIIVTLHGTAQELMVDLSSDPAMEESDIISYLVFGRGANDLSGNQAFSVEDTALSYTGGLLASELRTLLGDVAFIDTFSINAGSDKQSFGSVTMGKYITPELFVSYRQGLSQNEPSYQELSYELTPQIKLETQIGRDYPSSADITWEFDF